jgi:hypothetical protein
MSTHLWIAEVIPHRLTEPEFRILCFLVYFSHGEKHFVFDFLIFCAMPPKRALSLKQPILLSQIENIRKFYLMPMPLTKALHHTATRVKKQGLA